MKRSTLIIAICLVGSIAFGIVMFSGDGAASWIKTVDMTGDDKDFFRQGEDIRYSYNDTGKISDTYYIEIKDASGNVEYSQLNWGSEGSKIGYWETYTSGEYTISLRPKEEMANVQTRSTIRESPNPYPDSYSETWYVNHTNTDFMRLYFEYIEIMGGDYIRLYDASDQLLATYHYDQYFEYHTPWYETDSIRIEMTTSPSGNAAGFQITQYQYADSAYQNIQTASKIIESSHPYDEYQTYEWTITHVGTDMIRVHIDNLSIDEDDYLRFYDSKNTQIASFGKGYAIYEDTDIYTPWIDGEKVRITLNTDNFDETVEPWGFRIDEYQYGRKVDTTIASSVFSVGDVEIKLNKALYGQGETMKLELTPHYVPQYMVLVEDDAGFALQNWSTLEGNQLLELYIPAYWASGTYYVKVYHGNDKNPISTQGFDVQLYQLTIKGARGESSYYGAGEMVKYYFNINKLSDGTLYKAELGWRISTLGLSGILENMSNGTIEIPLPTEMSIPQDSYNTYLVFIWVSEGEEHNVTTTSSFRVANYGVQLGISSPTPIHGQCLVISVKSGVIRYGSIYARPGIPVGIEILDSTETRGENIKVSRNLTSDHAGYARWVFEVDSTYLQDKSYTVRTTVRFPSENITETTTFTVSSADEQIFLDYLLEKSRYLPGETVEITYWVTDNDMNDLQFSGTYNLFGHYDDGRIELLKSGKDSSGHLKYSIPDDDGLYRITMELYVTESSKNTFIKRTGWIDIMPRTTLNVDPGAGIYEGSESRTVAVILEGAEDWKSPKLFIEVSAREETVEAKEIQLFTESSAGRYANFTFTVPDNPPRMLVIDVFANDAEGRYLQTQIVLTRKGEASDMYPMISMSTNKDRYDKGDIVTVTIEMSPDFNIDDDFEYTVCSQGSEARTIAYGDIDDNMLRGKTTYSFSFEIPEDAEDGTYVVNALTGTSDDGWFELNLQASFQVGSGDDEGTIFFGIQEDSPLLLILFLLPIVISIAAIVFVVKARDAQQKSANGNAPAPSSSTPGAGSGPGGLMPTAPIFSSPAGISQPPPVVSPMPAGFQPPGRPPMGQSPIGQPPMGQPPMGQPPIGQPPMGPLPSGQRFPSPQRPQAIGQKPPPGPPQPVGPQNQGAQPPNAPMGPLPSGQKPPGPPQLVGLQNQGAQPPNAPMAPLPSGQKPPGPQRPPR